MFSPSPKSHSAPSDPAEYTAASSTQARMPWWSRSHFPAPTFCPP